MSDGLDPEIAALLAQSDDGASAGEAPAESDAGFSFDSPSDGAAAEFSSSSSSSGIKSSGLSTLAA